MVNKDRPIDRKANTPTVESEATDRERKTDGGQDRRPDLSHFDNFRVPRIKRYFPHVDLPIPSLVSVAMALPYLFVFLGALSVAYGATSLAAAHAGFYAALIVGGVFAFAYGYVGVRAVDAATRSGWERA